MTTLASSALSQIPTSYQLKKLPPVLVAKSVGGPPQVIEAQYSEPRINNRGDIIARYNEPGRGLFFAGLWRLERQITGAPYVSDVSALPPVPASFSGTLPSVHFGVAQFVAIKNVGSLTDRNAEVVGACITEPLGFQPQTPTRWQYNGKDWLSPQTFAKAGNALFSDINSSGRAVGQTPDAGSTGYRAFYQDNTSPDFNILVSPGGLTNRNSRALAVNSLGKIGGAFQDEFDGQQLWCATTWLNGGAIGEVICPTGWTGSNVTDLNDSGVAVGSATILGREQAFRYAGPTSPTRAWNKDVAFARVNAHGHTLLGTKIVFGNSDIARDIMSLVDNPTEVQGRSSLNFYDIGDNGQLVGIVIIDGVQQLVVATPKYSTSYAVKLKIGSLSDRSETASDLSTKNLAVSVVMGNHILSTATYEEDTSGIFSIPTQQIGDVLLRVRLSNTLAPLGKPDSWMERIIAIPSSYAGETITIDFPLNGDVDGDDMVTILDYLAVSGAFEKTSQDEGWNTLNANGISPSMADVDEDGEVSILDYLILSKNYEKTGDRF